MSIKEPTWFKNLKFDKDLEAYSCPHKLAGNSLDIFLFCDKSKEQRRTLADAADQLLADWPKQIEKMAKAIRNELVDLERVSRRDSTKISAKSIVPFSLSVFSDEEESHFSWGLHLPDLLEDDEYIDFAGDLANTWESFELVCSE